MTEKYGEDTSKHPIVDSGVWIKIGGENRKGRIMELVIVWILALVHMFHPQQLKVPLPKI